MMLDMLFSAVPLHLSLLGRGAGSSPCWFSFPFNTLTPARKYPGARIGIKQHEKARNSRIKLDGFLRVA